MTDKKKFDDVTLDDLKQIGGMGDKTAKSILEFRDQHSDIHDFSDLGEIEGIGSSTIEELRRHYTLD